MWPSNKTLLTALCLLAWLGWAGVGFAQQPATAGGEGVSTAAIPAAATAPAAEAAPPAAVQPAVAFPGLAPATQPAPTLDAGGRPSTTASEPAPPMQMVNGMLTLNFKDAPIQTLMDYLSEVAGFTVIADPSVTGRVTIISKQPKPVGEALSLINSVLKDKGFTAVQQSGRKLKIMTLGDVKTQSIPVEVGGNPADIEDDDVVVTRIIPVRFADAAQLRRDLTPLIPSYADLSANASSNTLIYTDTRSNIRRIAKIIEGMDTQMAVLSDVKVFQLKYAQATTVARMVNDVFRVDSSTSGRGGGGGQTVFGTGGGGRGGRGGGGAAGAGGFPGAIAFPGMPGAAGDQSGGGGGRSQRVTASGDDRTSTVVVSAPKDMMVLVEGVITDLDLNPVPVPEAYVIPLTRAQADNLAGVLNNLFNGTNTTASRTSTQTRTNTNTNTSRNASGTPGRTNSGFGQTSGTRTGGFGG